MQGLRSPQGLLTRTCTRSCKDLVGTTAPGFAKKFLISDKMQGPRISRRVSDNCQGPVEDHSNASYRMPAGSSQDLLTRRSRPWSRSLYIADLQDCTMKLLQDLHINSKDLFSRILGNQSKSAPRQNESDRIRTKCREGCGARSKFAPRHSESDPTRTKSRDSHHATTRRSDMHKVTRGLRVSAVVVYKVLRLPQKMSRGT